MTKAEVIELVRPKIQNKGAVSGTVNFDCSKFSHFTLSIEDDIAINLNNPPAPCYIILEVTHTEAGTVILNLPGEKTWDLSWEPGTGKTFLQGMYNGTSWAWQSTVYNNPDDIEIPDNEMAAAYIDAVEGQGVALDQDTKDGLHILFQGLDDAGITAKIKAGYLFLGGTAAACKLNMVNPEDTDEAFRLTYENTGGDKLSFADGFKVVATPGDANANTHLKPMSDLADSNSHIGVFAMDDFEALDANDLGRAVGYYDYDDDDTPHGYALLNITDAAAGFYMGDVSEGAADPSIADSKGFFLGSRNSISDIKLYRNGVQIASNTDAAASGRPNGGGAGGDGSLFISALNRSNDGGISGSTQRFGFVTIGDKLTGIEAADYYTLIAAFFTKIGRS